MLYNLSNPLDANNARTRLEMLTRKGVIVEMTEKRQKRSLGQNSYLHLILGYFASQTGNTLEWVKQQYYKRLCNPDIYIAEKYDGILEKTVKYVRSSASLTTDEMSLSIDRFRNWSAAEAGVYLPDAHSHAELAALQVEVERYKTYLY